MRARIRILAVAVLVSLGFAAAAAAGSAVEGAGQPAEAPVPGASPAQATQAALRAAVEVLKAHSQGLSMLVGTHQKLITQKPVPPASAVNETAQQAYRDALAAWSERMQTHEKQIQSGIDRLDAAEQRLDALAAGELPAATLKDVDAAHRTAAEARTSAQAALAAGAASPAGAAKPATPAKTSATKPAAPTGQ